MQHPAKVSDEGLARVPAEQLREVDALRAKEAQATDAIGRCDVAIRAAKNELEAAQPELKASDALVEQALAARKQAEYDRKTAAIEQAGLNESVSRARQQAANAWIRAAKVQVEQAEAAKRSAEAEREVIRSQIEVAKYDALLRTGDPESQKVQSSDLHARRDLAQQRFQEARRNEADLSGKLEQARTTWHQDRERYESMRGAGGTGKQ
jgi:chromosome segregation ATPase